MPYKLIDHQADIGLEATGETLEATLADGVRGLLSLMVRREQIRPLETVAIAASGADPGSLFVDLLNAVLASQDIHSRFFHDIMIDALEHHDSTWHIEARLTGEPIDLSRHEVDNDVKAATYGGLLVEQDERGWRLRCVLDL